MYELWSGHWVDISSLFSPLSSFFRFWQIRHCCLLMSRPLDWIRLQLKLSYNIWPPWLTVAELSSAQFTSHPLKSSTDFTSKSPLFTYCVCWLLSYSAHPSLSSLFIHSMCVSFSKPFKSCLLSAAAERENVTKVLPSNKQKKCSLSVCAFQFEVAKHSRFVFPSVFSLFLLLVDCCCLPKEELRTLDHVMKQSVTSQGEGRSSVDLFSSNRAMSSNLVFLGAHVLMQGRL